MITNFNEYKKPAFNVGDYVYLNPICPNSNRVRKNTQYEIDRVDKLSNGRYYLYKIKGFPINIFREDKFISEVEYNANKYNL